MPTAFCPHCSLAIGDGEEGRFPPEAMLCPHCRLTVAAGRARTGDDAGHASGSAAGVLASAARRTEGSPTVEVEAVVAALRDVAARTDTPVQRLRMLDYQRLSAADPDLPPLASILDACGTWKAARASAADVSATH